MPEIVAEVGTWARPYLSVAELLMVANVARYLDQYEGKELSFECRIIDANGEHAGTITVTEGGGYGLVFP